MNSNVKKKHPLLVKMILSAAGYDQVCASPREGTAKVLSQASARAGNQGNLTSKVKKFLLRQVRLYRTHG